MVEPVVNGPFGKDDGHATAWNAMTKIKPANRRGHLT
jgi:hypothetical protein